MAMEALRLPPADAEMRSFPAARSDAWRCAACCCGRPDMLLLDEPTNHLDAESVAWLERFLKEYTGTVVAVTHDRYFLDNVAEWILELDRGRGYPFKGNYIVLAGAEAGAAPARGEAGKRAPAQDQARARVGAGLAARASGQEQGASRGLRGARAESRARAPTDPHEISIPPGPRLGDLVIEANGLSKGTAIGC